MKILSAIIYGLFGLFLTNEASFPIDEHGKYTFSEVVEVPGLSRDALYKNGEIFIKKIKVLNTKKKFVTNDSENHILSNKGSFYVYRIGSIKKAIDGAVEYEILLECKDGKYRYTITNFVFNEYKRNRYGTYEPVKGKFYPLEMEMTNLNNKEWENHRQVVYEKSRELINNLYGEMIYSDIEKTKKVKKEENW